MLWRRRRGARRSFCGSNVFEPLTLTLSVAKRDLRFFITAGYFVEERLRPLRGGIGFQRGFCRIQIDAQATQLGMFEVDHFAHAPKERVTNRQRSFARTGGLRAPGDEPELRRLRAGRDQGLHQIKDALRAVFLRLDNRGAAFIRSVSVSSSGHK